MRFFMSVDWETNKQSPFTLNWDGFGGVYHPLFNLGIWEEVVGRSVSLKPDWSIEQFPEYSRLHRETLKAKIK